MKVLLVFATLWAGVLTNPEGYCRPTLGVMPTTGDPEDVALPYGLASRNPYDINTAMGALANSASVSDLTNLVNGNLYTEVKTIPWSLGRAPFGVIINQNLPVEGDNFLPEITFLDAEGTTVAALGLSYHTVTRMLRVRIGTCADDSEQQIDVTSSTAGMSTTPAYGIGLEIFQEEISESDPPSQRRRLRIFLKNDGNVFAYTDTDGHVTPEPLPEACITAMADTAVAVIMTPRSPRPSSTYFLNALDAETVPAVNQVALHPTNGATIFADLNDALSDTGSSTTVLRFEEDNCLKTDNYQWKDLPYLPGSCPASADGLTVPCPHIILEDGQTLDRDLCDYNSCCFFAGEGGAENRCLANPLYACTMSEKTAVDTGGSTSTIAYTIEGVTVSTTARTLGLGQSLTIQCQGDNWISAEGDIDTSIYSENPQVATFMCISGANQKTTDFDEIFTNVKCRAPCGKPSLAPEEIDKIIMDPFFVDNPDGKIAYGNQITLTCADGYATSTGSTSPQEFECSQSTTFDLKCYQCVIDAPTADDQFTYSALTSIINTPITKTCNTGYSFSNGDTSVDIPCNRVRDSQTGADVANFIPPSGFEQCTKDCRIVVDDDHGLETAPDEYLPQGHRFIITCASGRSLSEREKDNTEYLCGADGGDLNIPRCENECDLTHIMSTYNVFDEAGAYLTTTSTRSGKSHVVDCMQTDYDFLASVAQSLKMITCNDGVLSYAPGCFGKCAINDLEDYHNPLTEDDIIDVGLADSATADDIATYKSRYFTEDISSNKMRPGTTVRVTCKEEKLAETQKTTSYEVTCGQDAADVSLERCYDTCASSDLDDKVNSNTLLKATDDHSGDLPDKVPYFTVIDHLCQDSSYMMKSSDVTSVWKCGSGGTFGLNDGVSETNAKNAFCVAIPSLVVDGQTSTGYQSYQYKVVLPTDRDMTVDISSVKVQNAAGDLASDISVDVSSDHEYTITRTVTVADNELKLGESLKVVGLAIGTGAEGELLPLTSEPTVGPFYAGPPPVGADSITFSIVGQSVSLTWKDGFTTTWQGITGANYVPSFSVDLKKGSTLLSTINAAATLTDLVAITSIANELEPLTDYSIAIATSTSHGPGASESFSFKTGHNKLVLAAVDSESPTERTINIEMGASSLAGTHQVKYTLTPGVHDTEETEDITFADVSSVHNMKFENLQPLTAYVFTATIYTTEGTPSESESVSFSTGPTPPQELEAAQITFTDTEASIVIPNINAGYKYYVVVSKLVDSEWEVVSTQEFGGTDKKRDTTQEVTFGELEPFTTYKVEVSTEGTVDGTAIRSLPQSIQFTTHACETTTLTATGVTVGLMGSDAAPADHYSPDPNVVFVLTCEEGKILDEKDSATDKYTESVTAQTTCTAAGWAPVTPCIKKEEVGSSGLSTGAIIGIAVAGALALLLLIILLLCCCGCCRRSGGTTENGTSKNYSPRDNEKKQEEAPATELNAVVVEDKREEEPDIPAKEASDAGSRHSVEAKIEISDEPAAEEAEQKV